MFEVKHFFMVDGVEVKPGTRLVCIPKGFGAGEWNEAIYTGTFRSVYNGRKPEEHIILLEDCMFGDKRLSTLSINKIYFAETEQFTNMYTGKPCVEKSCEDCVDYGPCPSKTTCPNCGCNNCIPAIKGCGKSKQGIRTHYNGRRPLCDIGRKD